jgi:hypothetical protein
VFLDGVNTADTNAAVTSGATSWTSTAVVDSRSRAGSKHRPKSVGETGVRASQYSTSSARAAARSASAAVQARTDVPSERKRGASPAATAAYAVAKSSIRTGHDTTSTPR